MNQANQPVPTILVIFGGGGDLSWRKLVPALYNLFLDKQLPERFLVIGFDRKEMSDDELRCHLREGVEQFSRRGKAEDADWAAFASQHVQYFVGDFDDPGAFLHLSEQMAKTGKEWGLQPETIFYLATPPEVMEIIIGQLDRAKLTHNRKQSRVVFEKPFGHDYASARELNRMLNSILDEKQIYRIDHYLGKETVQNILALRFANALFEPIWDRRYIDHVQITVAEEVGVEHRGGYYEQAGALRDMVQNHLLQILCMVAMEPMVSFDANEIRNKKVDVLRAIRPIPVTQVHRFAVRGQYGAGWLEGQHFPAYRQEPGVSPASNTETYAALKLFVDNWRWQDVPFYLRTGKRLRRRVSEAAIQFLPVPHQSFPSAAAIDWQPNRLLIRIQPEEAILLRFQAKQPGTAMRLSPVDMRFSYQETFKSPPPEAYETLLLDVMIGDATLFMRADQVEASWEAIMPVLDAWQNTPPVDFPNYQDCTWGPSAGDMLIAQDGRHWFEPGYPQNPEKEGKV